MVARSRCGGKIWGLCSIWSASVILNKPAGQQQGYTIQKGERQVLLLVHLPAKVVAFTHRRRGL